MGLRHQDGDGNGLHLGLREGSWSRPSGDRGDSPWGHPYDVGMPQAIVGQAVDLLEHGTRCRSTGQARRRKRVAAKAAIRIR